MARWPWIVGGVATAATAAIVTAAVVKGARGRRRRRGGELGAVRVTLDRDRVAEMRERPAFYRASAQRLVDAACRISKRGDAWGTAGRKVFLGDVARGLPMARLAPMAVSFHNLGWVNLARADLPAAMDPGKVAGSEIDLAGRSTYHFLEIDPAKDC